MKGRKDKQNEKTIDIRNTRGKGIREGKEGLMDPGSKGCINGRNRNRRRRRKKQEIRT